MSIIVERVTSAEDLDGLLAVEEASFLNPWTRDMYLAELQNPAVSHLLVAKEPSGRVVGFCGFWCVLDELHINNLAVLSEYRRQGIASMILDRVFAEGRRAGAARATLEVRRSNDIARRFTIALALPWPGSGVATIGSRMRTPSCSGATGCRSIRRTDLETV